MEIFERKGSKSIQSPTLPQEGPNIFDYSNVDAFSLKRGEIIPSKSPSKSSSKYLYIDVNVWELYEYINQVCIVYYTLIEPVKTRCIHSQPIIQQQTQLHNEKKQLILTYSYHVIPMYFLNVEQQSW